MGQVILSSYLVCSILTLALPDKGKTKAKEDEKGDDPKAGADVGKIVNLMAGDANKVS